MTTPVQEPEQTLGYLMCHFRVWGCGWATSYKNPEDELEAESRRLKHERACYWNPNPRRP